MKVTVLFNRITESPIADQSALLAEEGAQEDAQLIAETLSGAGFTADIFELTPGTANSLSAWSTDLFFNLCDGIGNEPVESKVPQLLDKLKLSYTGSDSRGLLLTTDKEATKKIFQKEGVPTPKSFRLEKIPERLPSGFSFPLILKPLAQDCSLGITLGSVVSDLTQLAKEAKRLLSAFSQPVLVEEYIPGRELNVAILGTGGAAFALPISEVTFGDFFADKPKIVDFAAKWEEASPNCQQTVGVCPADLPKTVSQKVTDLALVAYRATSGRDYGRVDLRLDAQNQPYFLEVNLNPDISREAGFFRSAKAAGASYQDLITAIVESASRRLGLVVK